jgi:hypothetical protein
LMSADADQAGIREALRDGPARTFLRRPSDIDEFVDEIQAAREGRAHGVTAGDGIPSALDK